MKDEKLWGYLAAKASHQVIIELLLTFVTSGRNLTERNGIFMDNQS